MRNVDLMERQLTGTDSPYALKEVQFDGASCQIYEHAPRSLNDIYQKAQIMGDAPLIRIDEYVLSYGETFRKAAAFAVYIRNHFGVTASSRIAISVLEPSAWIIAFVAITSMGATAVLIGVDDPNDAQHRIRISRCSLLVTDGPVGMSDPGGMAGTRVMAVQDFLSRRGDLCVEASWLSLPSQREAIISFTDKTTGTSKGVIQTHLGVITGLMNMILSGLLARAETEDADWRAPSVGQPPCTLMLSPLCYIGGYGQLLLTLMLGGKLVFTSNRTASSLSELVDSQQLVSIAGINDVQLRELVRLKPDPGSLISIGRHGAALDAGLLAEVSERWPAVTVTTGYGMTETAGAIAVIAGESLRRKPASSGRILPSVQIKIVANDGRPLAIGELGEIYVRGASLLRGYCTERGDEQPLNDGWFKTGDIGCLSAEQHLYVLDGSHHVLSESATDDSTR